MKIQIPDSIDDAVKSLNGIESLLTAKGWERAAIVYVFTRDGEGNGGIGRGRDSRSSSTTPMLPREFAALGINGLKSDRTVREYRRLWAEHGTTPLAPGDKVQVPNLDFPPTAQGTPHHAQQSVEQRAATVRKEIRDPEVAPLIEEDLTDVVSDSTKLTAKTVGKAEEKYPRPESKAPAAPSSDDILEGMGIGKILKETIRKEKTTLERYISAIRRERDRLGLTERMTGIIRTEAIELREGAEMLRRYAAELEAAIGDEMGSNVPQPWIDQIEEEINVKAE